MKPSLSRFLGCLLGGALGDALGYPVEFAKSAEEIERVIGASVPLTLPRASAGKALVSDDTQMTLFTAEGCLRARQRWLDRGMCSPDVVMLFAYQRWLATQTGDDSAWRDPVWRGWLIDIPELHAQRAPGNTCLSALHESVRRKTGPHPSVSEPPNDSKGCGAIMRSAPVGLAFDSAAAAFELARDAAVLTHGHPSGYLAAGYFAAVISEVTRGAALPRALASADLLLTGERDHHEVARAVHAARSLANEPSKSPRADIERLGGGWVAEEALAIGIYCALTAKRGNVARALYRSVAHGGDSDSTGSITGNLLGAMWGVSALPKAWLDDLELRETIELVARDLHDTFVREKQPNEKRYPPN